MPIFTTIRHIDRGTIEETDIDTPPPRLPLLRRQRLRASRQKTREEQYIDKIRRALRMHTWQPVIVAARYAADATRGYADIDILMPYAACYAPRYVQVIDTLRHAAPYVDAMIRYVAVVVAGYSACLPRHCYYDYAITLIDAERRAP